MKNMLSSKVICIYLALLILLVLKTSLTPGREENHLINQQCIVD